MFRNILAIADNETTGPALEASNPALYNLIIATDTKTGTSRNKILYTS